MKYKLTYKNVKRINIRVSNNSVLVSAPYFISKRKIEEFLHMKKAWINKQLLFQKKHRDIQTIDYHQPLFIFNEKYQIKFSNVNKIALNDQKEIHLNNLDFENYQIVIKEFLKEVLKDYIESIRADFDNILKDYDKPQPNIVVKDLKGKWGVCHISKNKIDINSELIHYSKKALKYVLLHEYLHFIVSNHSKDFYNLINKYCPDYKEILQELNS